MSTANTPPADWPRTRITRAIEDKGLSLRRLGVANNLSPHTLKNALDRRWPRGERIIADALGLTPAEIWPSRYVSTQCANDAAYGEAEQ